jgi:hypothetical protein
MLSFTTKTIMLMLNLIMLKLNVIMLKLNVIMLNAIMLKVVVP